MTLDIDWAAAWKEEQQFRRRADDSAFWDKRAPSFAKTAGTTAYAHKFLELAHIQKDDVVFDMGCGSGTLALPLARKGHEVYAADFSKKMIDLMKQRAELDGVADLIHPTLLAWDEDWSEIDIPVCDLAFASRSIATDDLQAALIKLDSKARRKVCITLTTGLSPRTDSVLLEVVGRKLPETPDCVFAFNILWQMGIRPAISYINSARPSEYSSFDDAIEKNTEIMQLNTEEQSHLIAYSKEHLHEVTTADGSVCWEYDHQRVTSWAFLSWDKNV